MEDLYRKIILEYDKIFNIIGDVPSPYYIIITNKYLLNIFRLHYLSSLLHYDQDTIKWCNISYKSLTQYYPPLHPIIGERYMCHGNTLLRLNKIIESKQYFIKSKIIFRNIEGNDSEYVKTIEELLNVLKGNK